MGRRIGMRNLIAINKCPVCGEEVNGEYDICNKCGWENDPIQTSDPDFDGGTNTISLNRARTAFRNGKTFFSNEDF